MKMQNEIARRELLGHSTQWATSGNKVLCILTMKECFAVNEID